MEVSSILFIIIIIVLLYIVVRYVFSDVNTLTNVSSATTMSTIPAKSLSTNGSNINSTNFTYSIWFYIQDWNYRYGEPKIIYGRMGSLTSLKSKSSLGNISGQDPCPSVTLGAIQNDISIALTLMPGADASALSSDDVTDSLGNIVHTCNVSNVPIQRWVNLLISVYGKSLDVYLDGKLVKTCILPGVPHINQDANVYVTPLGGFSGWTSKFQYYPTPTDPQTAWNIYQKGYSGNWLSNWFGNYQVKVAFLENGKEDGSFTI